LDARGPRHLRGLQIARGHQPQKGQRKMLYDVIRPTRSGISRFGMTTTRPIPAGTIVWHPCHACAVWSAAELATMRPEIVAWLEEFGYWLTDGSIVTACQSGYTFNHSCDSSLLDYGLDFSIAVRDIAVGEELTIDYRTLRNEQGWKFLCHCRTGSPELKAYWEDKLRPALAMAGQREQPLRPTLVTQSQSYRSWLMTDEFAVGRHSVCDPRPGLSGPARLAYLRQEMMRISIPESGIDGGLSAYSGAADVAGEPRLSHDSRDTARSLT
jgi:hypothetical protein